MEKQNLYIRVIKYCNTNFPEGFTYNEVINAKELKLLDWEDKIISEHFANASAKGKKRNPALTLESMFIIIKESGKTDYISDDSEYSLSFNAQFKYLDYQELVEARKMSEFAVESSKTAKKHALIAIGISIAGLILSIYFSNKQINTPININENQIENLKFDSSSINTNLENLTKAQNELNSTIKNYQESLKEIPQESLKEIPQETVK